MQVDLTTPETAVVILSTKVVVIRQYMRYGKKNRPNFQEDLEKLSFESMVQWR